MQSFGFVHEGNREDTRAPNPRGAATETKSAPLRTSNGRRIQRGRDFDCTHVAPRLPDCPFTVPGLTHPAAACSHHDSPPIPGVCHPCNLYDAPPTPASAPTPSQSSHSTVAAPSTHANALHRERTELQRPRSITL